ncbi:MAG: B12-binding domain-containing radical SAM protein [Candidatus Omnitrophica bacterium]|nr:B12-binding domain-containing radical SAM protein [Candidatus Omnitrophota bacterium]
MKVLFVIEDTYGGHDMLGVGILSSIAKRKGCQTGLFVRSQNSGAAFMERITAFKPDIIAYSFATGEHRAILKLHREIKARYPCHYIFGGPHPTYFPEFINEDGVDTICVGEGEIAFGYYLDRVEKNEDFSDINNLVVKKGDRINNNPLNFLIEDLDFVPFPDRRIFRQELPDIYKFSILMYTSRGCPNSCTYCSNPKFNKMYEKKGRVMRLRSVGNVIEEITTLESRPPIIMFLDDNFLVKPGPWIEEFVGRYGREVKIPFTICTSSNLIKEPIIKSLKEIGLRSVVYALETGDDEINRNLLKRPVKVDSVIEAGRVLRKYKIFSTLQSITLLPVPDPFKLDLKTLKVNQRIKPSLAVSTPLTPYPGTEIAEYSIARDFLNRVDMDEIEKINKVSTILNFKNKTSMKKSLIVHYLFDLMVSYPAATSLCRYYFLIPARFYKFFYNMYEIIFACKRHFLYLGVRPNLSNVKDLLRQYMKYKFPRRGGAGASYAGN